MYTVENQFRFHGVKTYKTQRDSVFDEPPMPNGENQFWFYGVKTCTVNDIIKVQLNLISKNLFDTGRTLHW